jgi:hypothetical protein
VSNQHAITAVPKQRIVVASLVLVLWLGAAAGSFWWFTMKDLRPFAGEVKLGAQSFDGQSATRSLEALLAAHTAATDGGPAPRATILHFWDPGCACSRFNESHVQQLIADYRAAGVQLLVLDKQDLQAGTVRQAFGSAAMPYRGADLGAVDLEIPASPAAAVFDRDGRLAYFGPYSEGAACLAGNGDFVEQVLDKLLAGEAPSQINISAFGCFCNWREPGQANA